MRTALSLHLAYEHVRAGFGRMALSLLAIALGVALVVAVSAMNAAVLSSFMETVDGVAGRAALTVTAGEGLTFPEDVRARVESVPGVKLAVPLVRGVAFPDDGSGELLTVHGVDLTHDAEVRVYHDSADPTDVIDDLLVFLSQRDSIVLGREFARTRGLAVGGTLTLVTPTGTRPFTVRGLLDPQGLAKTLAGRIVVMDLLAAEEAFTSRGQVNQIDVLVNEGTSAQDVKDRISSVLPQGLSVEEPAVRKELIRKTVEGFQAMITAFALLAVVAGFVICYSRLGAIFEARTWEAGLFRSVGLRRSTVFLELLKESLLLGSLGVLAGIPLGLSLARYALPAVTTATAINFHMPVAATDAPTPNTSVLLGAVIGVMAAVLGAALPAARLARKDPVAALTMRGREEPAHPRQLRVTLGLASLALLLVIAELVTRRTLLGMLTTLAIVAAVFFGASDLVTAGSRLLGRTWTAAFRAAGALAAEHIAEHPRRAGLAAATIGVGLASVLLFGILAWSFERTLVSQLAPRNEVDLVITSSLSTGGYMTAPLPDRLLDDMRKVDGVARVCGEQRKDIHFRGQPIVINGFDAACFDHFAVARALFTPDVTATAVQRIKKGQAALVSGSLAFAFGVRPGDVLTLDSPNGTRAFHVVGVTNAEPVPAVIVDRTVVRQAWNDDFVSWIRVDTSGGMSKAQVAAALRRQFAEKYRLQIRSGPELVAFYGDQVRRAFQLFYPMEVIIFVLLLIGLSDALATSVLERTRYIGMMRAVGISRRRMALVVVLEALAIGVVGLLLAAIAGVCLGLLWVRVEFPGLLGWQLELHFPTQFALGASALTLLTCIAASLLPAVHAARLPVPAALRNE